MARILLVEDEGEIRFESTHSVDRLISSGELYQETTDDVYLPPTYRIEVTCRADQDVQAR
jgi:hypothetical protein